MIPVPVQKLLRFFMWISVIGIGWLPLLLFPFLLVVGILSVLPAGIGKSMNPVELQEWPWLTLTSGINFVNYIVMIGLLMKSKPHELLSPWLISLSVITLILQFYLVPLLPLIS